MEGCAVFPHSTLTTSKGWLALGLLVSLKIALASHEDVMNRVRNRAQFLPEVQRNKSNSDKIENMFSIMN